MLTAKIDNKFVTNNLIYAHELTRIVCRGS